MTTSISVTVENPAGAGCPVALGRYGWTARCARAFASARATGATGATGTATGAGRGPGRGARPTATTGRAG
ncbi:hypothetical protein, partial [Streptomyces crystallinus]|uniref:hypothetical protein n=1 Tax=Streptomyces crystallinus TaxID=68191 RepID=UPI0031DF6160